MRATKVDGKLFVTDDTGAPMACWFGEKTGLACGYITPNSVLQTPDGRTVRKVDCYMG